MGKAERQGACFGVVGSRLAEATARVDRKVWERAAFGRIEDELSRP